MGLWYHFTAEAKSYADIIVSIYNIKPWYLDPVMPSLLGTTIGLALLAFLQLLMTIPRSIFVYCMRKARWHGHIATCSTFTYLSLNLFFVAITWLAVMWESLLIAVYAAWFAAGVIVSYGGPAIAGSSIAGTWSDIHNIANKAADVYRLYDSVAGKIPGFLVSIFKPLFNTIDDLGKLLSTIPEDNSLGMWTPGPDADPTDPVQVPNGPGVPVCRVDCLSLESISFMEKDICVCDLQRLEDAGPVAETMWRDCLIPGGVGLGLMYIGTTLLLVATTVHLARTWAEWTHPGRLAESAAKAAMEDDNALVAVACTAGDADGDADAKALSKEGKEAAYGDAYHGDAYSDAETGLAVSTAAIPVCTPSTLHAPLADPAGSHMASSQQASRSTSVAGHTRNPSSDSDADGARTSIYPPVPTMNTMPAAMVPVAATAAIDATGATQTAAEPPAATGGLWSRHTSRDLELNGAGAQQLQQPQQAQNGAVVVDIPQPLTNQV